MSDPLFSLVVAICASVAIVLSIGIGTFGQGGAGAGKRANRLMQLRILLQFIAVALILTYVYFRNQGS